MDGTDPVYLEGIACQPLPAAIAAASKTMGADRAVEAASEALARGYITKEEEERIKEEVARRGGPTACAISTTRYAGSAGARPRTS